MSCKSWTSVAQHRQEVASLSLNTDDGTVKRVKLAVVSGWEGWYCTANHTITLANHEHLLAHVCGRG